VRTDIGQRGNNTKNSAPSCGAYECYEIAFNYESIGIFYEQVKQIWYKWLNRRSTKLSQS
jgi:hypothetical protein